MNLQTLDQFQVTKQDRETFALNIIQAIDDGDIDALKVHVRLKNMESIIKLLNDNTRYKSSLLEAAGKYGSKKFEYQGASIETKEVGVKYDYSKCGDLVMDELLIKQAELDGLIKEREKFLKSAPIGGLTIVDQKTGEVVTVYPPAKSSTTSIAVTLK